MKNLKKIVFRFAIVTVLLFGITSCDGYKTETDDIVTADDVKEIIIPTEQAKELYDTYTKRREGLIRDFENAQDSLGKKVDTNDDQNQQGQNDKDGSKKSVLQRNVQQSDKGFKVVRYSYYDFETLKKYMAFIEQEADRANVNISTLRFYFTNYPNKDTFDNQNPVKEPRRNTFVMIPTVNTGNEEFAFFTADDSEDGQRKAFLLSEELAENGKSYRGNGKEEASLFPKPNLFRPTNAAMPAENEQSLAGNEGGLRPPK